MSDERFVCIDIGYGDDWYITDDGKKLSEMEIVNLLNSLSNTIAALREENKRLKRENKALESNMKWFAYQLKNPTLYSDDFLETLETIEGEETVEKIREKQKEIIKNLKKGNSIRKVIPLGMRHRKC